MPNLDDYSFEQWSHRPENHPKGGKMKVHLRADEANGTHTKVTVFMNGSHCGQLCMKEEESIFFHELIMRSKYPLPTDEIISSGIWFKENP